MSLDTIIDINDLYIQALRECAQELVEWDVESL
jgi:hypothetical protein